MHIFTQRDSFPPAPVGYDRGLGRVLRLEVGEVDEDGGAKQVGTVDGVGPVGEDHLSSQIRRDQFQPGEVGGEIGGSQGASLPGSCRRPSSTPS